MSCRCGAVPGPDLDCEKIPPTKVVFVRPALSAAFLRALRIRVPGARVLSVLVTAALVAGCAGAGSPATAASIGDQEITIAEVEEEFEALSEAPQVRDQLDADTTGEAERGLQANVLTTLIREELLEIAAEELDIEVTQEDLDAERAEVVEASGGEEAFQQALEQNAVSEEELEGLLRSRVIQARIGEEFGEEVSDEDVRAAFDEDAQGQYGEQVEVRHILVETEEEAQQAIERIEGGEDFATVAEEMSTDPGSAQQGGDLGLVARGTTVEAFEEAAFGAEVGELVGPVESEFGFHVLEVTDRVAGPAFEDVQEEIRAQLEGPLRDEAFRQYLDDLLSRIEVEINPRFGTWDAEQIAVVPSDPLGTPDAEGSAAPGGATPAPGESPAPDASPAPDSSPVPGATPTG